MKKHLLNIRSMRNIAARGVLIAAAPFACLGVSTAIAASNAPISDSTINAHVKANLMQEDTLEGSNIHVTTNNGVVTLEGSVYYAGAKLDAENIASFVPGVKRIEDKLTIVRG